MKIYHGSKIILRTPIYKGSNPRNDYGPCFYTTDDFVNASIWACRNDGLGYVNEYKANLNGLKILDLTNKDQYSVLNWIAILLKFRVLDAAFEKMYHERIQSIIDQYYINIEDYDIVVGYRADDAYFRFPKEFVNGNLTLDTLEKVFELGRLGIQYAFVSLKAIKRIKFVKASLADAKYVGAYFEQVSNATKLFDEILYESINSKVPSKTIKDLIK